MNGLKGTWQLVRVNLRLDRVKLPVAIIALCLMLFFTVSSVVDLYGTSQEGLLNYAATSAPSVVGRAFAGPLHGPELGSVVLNEGFLFTAIAVAFISTLTVIRHTRQNEETDRSELIGSMIVAKHSPLVAALITALFANLAIAVLSSLVLIVGSGGDLPIAGSVLTGATLGCIGLVFAGLAGIVAQLTDGARSANAICALIIGLAFLFRAIGDVTGNLVNNGLGVQSTFASWLSPLGWGQQVYAYTENNIWILGLFAISIIISTGIATYLMTKRDIGSGIFATKPGRSRAKNSLLSTFGLARRLQAGIFRGWAFATIVLSVSYGLSLREFQGFLEDNEEFREAISSISDSSSNINYIFLSVLIAFMGITIAGYVAQALLRMRSEESSGRVESILGTSVSRTKWMLSHISYVIMGAIVLTIISALGMGITYVVSTSAPMSQLWDVVFASITQITAIAAFAGFVIALFSFLPNLAMPIAWGGFAACIVILQLGVVLDLPQWIIDISPFGHLPAMPADSFQLAPVMWLSAFAISLSIVGIVRFRNRDVVL